MNPMPPVTTTDQPVNTGVMVALRVPLEVAQELALPGGEPPELMHITLAYIGDSAELDPALQANIAEQLSDLATQYGPIEGTISGVGVFNGEGATNPFYASYDSPSLPWLRNRLVGQLEATGISVAQNHGFTPHITLAYVPKGEPIPAVELPNLELAFTELCLYWADEIMGFPFDQNWEDKAAKDGKVGQVMHEFKHDQLHSGSKKGPKVRDRRQALAIALSEASKEYAARKAANYNARAGGQIAGGLYRGGDGKFTGGSDGGSASEGASSKPSKANTRASQREARQKLADQQAADRKAQADQDRQDKKDSKFQAVVQNVSDLSSKLLGDDMAEVLSSGTSPDNPPGDLTGVKPEYGDQLVAKGLAVKYQDGTYDMSPTGRSMLRAMSKGNEKAAHQAIMRAQAAADRKAAVAARRANVKHRTRKELNQFLYKALKARAEKSVKETEPGGFAVCKDVQNHYRWITVSSSGYQDRDQETVATKALESDADRCDATGKYGPLLWWHMPEIELGKCDFNAMHGPFLIESGTFANPEIGEMFARNKETELGVSIGFYHPYGQGVKPGRVYQIIEKKERSILPAWAASNVMTTFDVSKPAIADKEVQMNEKKKGFLSNLFGVGGEEKVNQLLTVADAKKEQATQMGLAFKAVSAMSEKAAAPAVDPAMAGGDPSMDDPTADPTASDPDTDTDTDPTSGTDVVSELRTALHEDLDDMIDASVTNALKPLQEKIDAMVQSSDVAEATATATKEASNLMFMALKEVADNQSKLLDRLAGLESAMKQLAGEVPVGNSSIWSGMMTGGYRASADKATEHILTSAQKELAEKGNRPEAADGSGGGDFFDRLASRTAVRH